MRKLTSLLSIFMLITCLVTTGCTNREIGTASGAAIGGVAGNLITGGSGVGTVVGAGAGALIGNQISK